MTGLEFIDSKHFFFKKKKSDGSRAAVFFEKNNMTPKKMPPTAGTYARIVVASLYTFCVALVAVGYQV